MKKTLKTVELLTLEPHPSNKDLYGVVAPGGFDQNLIKSLQKEVWPGDIQITTGNVIISGHRRIEHCAEGNVSHGAVWVRDDLPEDPMSPEVLEALLEANLQRNKDEWTISQELKLWNEVEVLFSRRKAQAAQKAAQLAPHGNQAAAKSSKRAEVPAIKKAADRMGLEEGEEKLRHRVQVVKAVEKAVQAGDTEKAEEVKKALNSSPGAAVRMAKAVGLIETKPKKSTPVVVEEKKEEAKPLKLTGGEKLKAWWCHPDIPKQQLKNIQAVMRDDIDYEDQELRPSPYASKWILEYSEELKRQAQVLDMIDKFKSDLIKQIQKTSKDIEKEGRGVLHGHMQKVELHLKDHPRIDACPAGYRELLEEIEARAFDVVQYAHSLRYAYGWEKQVVWERPKI